MTLPSRLTPIVLWVAAAALLPSAPAAAPAAKSKRAAAHAAALAVPFLEDDYTRAVAQARERRVPIFIEAWAPW